jgi:hypothetical protein
LALRATILVASLPDRQSVAPIRRRGRVIEVSVLFSGRVGFALPAASSSDETAPDMEALLPLMNQSLG